VVPPPLEPLEPPPIVQTPCEGSQLWPVAQSKSLSQSVRQEPCMQAQVEGQSESC
jgi:hypothetical protein